MANYGISFKHDNSTIMVEAEFFDIKDGFLRLYKMILGVEVVESVYDAENIRHCVLQKEYSEAEILYQIKD